MIGLLAAVAVILAVVFFALTRTEVGRDLLRTELERTFAAQFDGTLEIDALQGNLLQHVFASGVRVKDDQGRIVLRADSVVVRPRWRMLLDRTIVAGNLTIIRPELDVVFEDGSTNIGKVFGRDTSPPPGARPWRFETTRLDIIDGTVRTTGREAAVPLIETGVLFDYTNALVREVNGEASFGAGGTGTTLTLRKLSFRLEDGFEDAFEVNGGLVFRDRRLSIPRMTLRSGATDIHMAAHLPVSSDAEATTEPHLTIDRSQIDGLTLRRFFPASPASGVTSVNVRMHGALDRLVVEEIALSHNRSRVEVSGTIVGLPHLADYELGLSSTRLYPEDIASLLPELSTERYRRLGQTDVEAIVAGIVDLSADGSGEASLEGTMRLQTERGEISGPVNLNRADDGAMTFLTDLRGTGVEPEVLIDGVPVGTRINGRVRAEGRLMDGRPESIDLRSWFGNSTIGERMFDSIGVAINMDAGIVRAQAGVRQGVALATLTGAYEMGVDVPTFDAEATVRNLDAADWWLRGDPLTTRLHGKVAVAGRGRNLDDLEFEASADVYPSTISYDGVEDVIPPHRHHLVITRPDGHPVFRLRGDVLHADARVDARPSAVLAELERWSEAIAFAVRREQEKQYEPDGFFEEAAATPAGMVEVEPIRIEAAGRFVGSRILASIYPGLAGLSTDAAINIEASLGPNSIITGAVSADSVITSAVRSTHLAAAFSAGASRVEGIHETASADVSVSAAAFDAFGQRLRNADVGVALANGAGSLDIRSDGEREAERLHIAADVEIGRRHNSLHFRTIDLESASSAWMLAASDPILIFSDAVKVTGLELAARDEPVETRQQLRLEGVVSNNAGDTLYAAVEHVRLHDLSEMLRMRDPIGGVLNGHLALTGVLERPQLTGEAEVGRLTLAGRPLGHLALRSGYAPGRPDIALDAVLSPLADGQNAVDDPRVAGGEALNDLRIHGHFQLPVPGPDRRLLDPGLLDLVLDVRHADAFFMDLIFRNEISDVGGIFSGTGHIAGDFRSPLFDAFLRLTDGTVRIPEFNLQYQVDGHVSVDADAIRVHGANVSDATGGRAILNGGILFNDYRFFSFDLRADLDRLQFMNVASSSSMGFFGDVRASGEVTLSGPLDQARLHTTNAVITPESSVYIAILEGLGATDAGYIVFADSLGNTPTRAELTQRRNLLDTRPEGERMFVDGIEMDLNIFADQGTTVHLVVDPVSGDVINARGSGRIQLLRNEGDYSVYGTLNVDSGDYLFTAGDVFVRRFLIDGGSITWDGEPDNAALDIMASYRTRASAAGLPILVSDRARIPLIVQLNITGRVAAPMVDLQLQIDRTTHETITAYESIESILNQPERSTEYATSVMLTNSFLLTTSLTSYGEETLSATRNQLAFHSLSQLVATQLNRYLSQAVPNLDVNLGLQGENTQDLDVSYGVALRLMDERLVIRGQGLYQYEANQEQQNLLDEFVVELRLSNSVSVEVFYRREGDILGSNQTLANTTGAGLSYETRFRSWSRLVERFFGRNGSSGSAPESTEETAASDDVSATAVDI